MNGATPTPSVDFTSIKFSPIKPKKKQPLNKHATCAMPLCPNPNGIKYYKFPKDEKYKKLWVIACKRGDKGFNPNTARICENHFVKEDFVRDLKSEMLGTPAKKNLRKDAVPSVDISRTNMPPKPTDSRHKKTAHFVAPAPPPPPLLPTESPTLNATNRCSVKTCKSPNGIKYFSFPKDEQLQMTWLEVLNLKEDFEKNGFKIKNAKVCSSHFSKDAFEDSFGYKTKTLKKNAIPRVNVAMPVPLPSYDEAMQEDAFKSYCVLTIPHNEDTTAAKDQVSKPIFKYFPGKKS